MHAASIQFGNSFLKVGIATLGILAASGAYASTMYDTSLADPPGYYNGSGNPNEGFTVTTEGQTEIGLGVQYRKSGPQVHPTPSIGSVYEVNNGFYTYSNDFCFDICSSWNIEFSPEFGRKFRTFSS